MDTLGFSRDIYPAIRKMSSFLTDMIELFASVYKLLLFCLSNFLIFVLIAAQAAAAVIHMHALISSVFFEHVMIALSRSSTYIALTLMKV